MNVLLKDFTTNENDLTYYLYVFGYADLCKTGKCIIGTEISNDSIHPSVQRFTYTNKAGK